HVTAGEVDGGSLLEGDAEVRLVRRDECLDDAVHVAAGEVVRLELARAQWQPRLRRSDQRSHDGRRTDLPEPHADQLADADTHAGEHGLDPEPDGDRPAQDEQEDDDEDEQYRGKREWIHSRLAG